MTFLDIVWTVDALAPRREEEGGGQVIENMYVKVGSRVEPRIGPSAIISRFSIVSVLCRMRVTTRPPNRVDVSQEAIPTTAISHVVSHGLPYTERALHQRLASITIVRFAKMHYFPPAWQSR